MRVCGFDASPAGNESVSWYRHRPRRGERGGHTGRVGIAVRVSRAAGERDRVGPEGSARRELVRADAARGRLERLTATLLRDGRPIFDARIGVGAPAYPTPAGEFYIRSKLRSVSHFYGPLAFGTSARSAVLTDWPDGGFVGVHGNDRPDLLLGRVSDGCIRMRNADILELGRLMPVGTPVTIRLSHVYWLTDLHLSSAAESSASASRT